MKSPARSGPGYAAGGPGGAYHGYHFRILTAQGKNAKGGAYDYINKGRMNGGFALIAWPAKYGYSGIMSFMVSHEGVVYQKTLGPGGDAIAAGHDALRPRRQLAGRASAFDTGGKVAAAVVRIRAGTPSACTTSRSTNSGRWWSRC